MEESNLTKCKICNQMKNRIQSGKFTDNINKRWVDENQLLWNGRVCPECHQVKMKQKAFERRQIRKSLNEDAK